MSSLHWEARRRQNVADKMQMLNEANNPTQKHRSKDQSINDIADKFCTDPAIPTHFLLNQSKAALSRDSGVEVVVEDEKMEGMAGQSEGLEKRYTARIPNRYSSMNYIQQY